MRGALSVTIVTTVYGNYRDFVPRWWEAIDYLDPPPDRVIIAGDRPCSMPGCDNLVAVNMWRYPQAYYQHFAISLCETDWVWISDVDDLPMLDALAGLEDLDADVWQLGFLRSDGERYIPPTLTNEAYLALDRNPYVGTSMIRTEAYKDAGGFRDVAYQDWELWRRFAVAGYTFEASGRAHFHYMLHHRRRGEVELTADARPEHLAEMMESLAIA